MKLYTLRVVVFFFFKLHSKDQCFRGQPTKKSIVILVESSFVIAILILNIIFNKFDWIK